METPVAYYSDGVPYDSSGNVIITISNGVSGSVGANSKSPSPVFVNWPGMGGPHGGGGGIIDYNPNKLPFTGLWKMSEGVTKINKLLEQARNAYPQNAEQIRDEASALLADLRNTGLINNPDINPAANALQEAVNSLQINIDLKNQTELAVSSASQDAVNAFREFMNNNKLSNFIDKPADMIDLAIATSRWLHKPWDNTVVPKFSAEIEVKNKLVTYLDRGNTITADVVSKKNALAEVKSRAESQAKADAEAKARDELFAKAGVKPAPVYTSQMVAEANAALKAPDAMVLSQAPGSVQIAMVGVGVWTAAGDVAGNISRWFAEALSKVSVPEVSPLLLRLSLGTLWFHSEPAGQGSDIVPGRSLDAMFALNAQMLAGQGVKIEPGATSVNLPVRGQLVTSNGQLALDLLKTGNESIPAAVPVLNAVRDTATGLDKITLPAVVGAPSRTILVNPAPQPPAPTDTGNNQPVPVTPVHTGTEVKPVEIPVTTITPVSDAGGFRDFIYWRPDATGMGVEPVYVMLSQDPRKLPGKATGKGQGTGENWLNDANKGIGVPIPSRIADKLRGREFANFDAFRKALWTEVGKDPELLKQFKNQNKVLVTKGKSSFVPESERVGERERFELHHIKRVTDGGAVYDIDNLRVVTPKHHIEIHRGNK